MKPYDHKKIEKKWQKHWEKNKLYRTPDTANKKDNQFLLVEFPYPSGNLHVGHWYAFSIPDILARTMRMQGKNVLYPIGFDAFGLPAENAAIKNKLNPNTWTEGNMKKMREQIRSMGASFDWSREVVTCHPDYYRWTQWQFLQFFKNDLAYKKETPVNWCPKDKTVLANEQVVNGRCERCDSEVEQRNMLQWNLRITKYADRLVDDLNGLDWPEQIKESQRNWIGRSEGSEIDFPLSDDVKRIILLHGRGGSPTGGPKVWLKEKLEKLGYEVQVPQLPNTDEPNDEEQADYVQKHCTLDNETAIVGHSFGGIVALRLLERGVKLKRVALVSVPFSGKYLDGKKRESVTKALKKGFDFDTIRKNAHLVALYDVGDQVVSVSDGEAYAKALDCHLMKETAQERHYNGPVEPDVFSVSVPVLRVFTTRPDTLFGATYMVIAPEHPFVTMALRGSGPLKGLKNPDAVKKYVEASKKKSELDRMTDQKDKTGIKIESVEATNPATGEKIPLFIADYVLGHYGTGAIMAVPAHDERDAEFAKKFGVPTKQVIARVTHRSVGTDAVRADIAFKDRNAVMCIVKHWEKDEYLCLQWKDHPEICSFVSGGIEGQEDPVAAGKREIREESGYTNAKFVREIGGLSYIEFFHQIKKTNVRAKFRYLYYELENGDQAPVSIKELGIHSTFWKKKNEVYDFLTIAERDLIWKGFTGEVKETLHTGDGYLVNSGAFDGMENAEAKRRITEKNGIAKRTYKLRDWIVSRQRYWGVPIPIIHCPKCGDVAVPDKQLPVLLPAIKDYLPTGDGKSPLAKVKKWVNVKCPQCKGNAERETDTFDTFIDSSWYFLRYTDPKNKKVFADKKKMDHWMPVGLYSGGAEHTTMHVLYSRFWQKALYDLGLVKDEEPYRRRMNRSIILGPDNQKMSKSRGNVIDPDAVVEKLGADTVRMYLSFIGPYSEVSSYPWNPDGVVGVRRFLERVWKLSERVAKNDNEDLNAPLHKMIKKVSEDNVILKFNTAISAMMIFLNAAEKGTTIGKRQWETFLKLLAPFAPHITEELWTLAGHKKSIHLEVWPDYEEKFLKEDTMTIAIQVNGKTRGIVTVSASAGEEEVRKAADNESSIQRSITGKKLVRQIYVQGRILNIVVID